MGLVTPGVYSGTSFSVIDGKGRIAVPAGLRNNIPEIEHDGRRERVLWVGSHGKLPCLVAFGHDQYGRLFQDIELARAEARDLRREFDHEEEERKRFASIDSYVLDGSGRFSPVWAHRRRCGASGPVAFVGAGRRFEIWSVAVLADCAAADRDLREMAAEVLAENGGR